MWDLIKLEYRKYKIKNEVLGFILGNLILYSITIFANSLGYLSTKGLVMKATSTFGVYNTILSMGIGVVIVGGFAFFECFNEEIEENSIKISYLFPQGKKNIIRAKALATLLFTAVISIVTYITQTILLILTKDMVRLDKNAFNLTKFIDNIPNFLLTFIISILLVFFIILIAIVIKSTTFNTFSIIIIGIGSTVINSYFIEIMDQYSILIKMGLLLGLGFILTLAFSKILKAEVKKDI